MPPLFLLDASGYIYRSYFAIRNMTNSHGESTNALYGFIRSVNKLIKDFKPEYLVAVFDGPRNAEKRVAIYPEYKAHRAEMPGDLRYQIDWARTFCELAGIPMLFVEGAEADDVMGSIAKWGSHHSQVFLCTSDKDMCQLVDKRIVILNTFKENQVLNVDDVLKIHGVLPEKMIDLLAMVGDASDNVPGLAGFGPKTAAELLQKFGSLDHILEHPEEIPGSKKQEVLKRDRELALLSRRLVTIDTNVAIPSEYKFYALRESHLKELKDFYARMNFNTLLKELEANTPLVSSEEEIVDYRTIEDLEALDLELKELSQKNEVAIALQNTPARPFSKECLGVALSVEAKKGIYIPFNGKLGKEALFPKLKSFLESSAMTFVGHDMKEIWHLLANCGIRLKNIGFDTHLASYLLNSHTRQHSLENLILENFGKGKQTTVELTGKGKKQIGIEHVSPTDLGKVACEEADYTWRLKGILQKNLDERKLTPLLKNLELPLLMVLAEMERKGIFADASKLQQQSEELKIELNLSQEEIFKDAGIEFNLNSPQQLEAILYDRLQIPYPKRRTEKQRSTAEEILELLKEGYPICGKILEYRKLEKLRSTYVEALPLEIDPKDGRIHCTFNQTVAATGRLSCQDPNLQNIPMRTEKGRKIREAFRPEKSGWSYLAADYSQIELRLLAHFSEDPYLIEAFKRNLDIHSHTAASVYGIPLEEVTKEQRQNAKAVNFGLLYGQGAFGLSQGLSISPKEAQNFIHTYFEKFTKVRSFLEESKEKARVTGKATTLIGRERQIPEILSKNGMLRAQAERLALNTPIQGSAADIIKLAMLEVDKQLHKLGKIGYMILQIHDELIFEVPDFELIDMEQIVRRAMEKVVQLKVPLLVDISIGKNWKEC